MRRAILRVAAFAALCAVPAALSAGGEEGRRTDGEIWNEGVDFYRAGDATNALKTLRPLLLSRSHGARAAEIVARLEHDEARRPGGENALAHLEEAAVAAQIALRAAPDDPRANANFTRATDGLAALRETARVNAAIAAGAGKDPASMLSGAVRDIRALATNSLHYATNPAPVAVRLSREYAAKAEKLSDVWIPLKDFASRSSTNEADVASVLARMDAARAKTERAAELLSDMDADARYPLFEVEQDFTDLYKAAVMPHEAMTEDLAAQSNAWLDVETAFSRPWQREALDFTRAFRARFPQWADSYAQQAASDTNAPPFTAEARAEVENLSAGLEQLQELCCGEQLPPKQEEAIGIILRILELLPRQSGGGGGGQQSNPQGGENDKNEKKDDSGSDGDGGGRNDESEGDGGESENTPPEPEGEDEKDGQGGGDDRDDREIEAVLRKAQERSDEHEAAKKARMRKERLPAGERDW